MPIFKDENGNELSQEAASAFLEEKGIKSFSQVQLDDMVNGRLRRQEKDFKDKITESEGKIAQYEKDLAEAKKNGTAKPDLNDYISKKEHDELLKQKDVQIGERDTKIGSLNNKMIDKELFEAASLSNAQKPDMIVELLRNRMAFAEDGSIRPIDKDGNKIPVKGGEGFHDVKSYVTSYLGEEGNGFLVKPSGNSGAGTKQGAAGSGSSTHKSIEELSQMGLDQFQAAGGLRGANP